jgi:CAAX protease family protein
MFEKVFVENGSVRPFIRFLVSVVGILTLITCVGFLAVRMPSPLPWLSHGQAMLFWYNILLLPGLLALYKLLTMLLDHRPLRSVGLTFHSRWKNELGIGLAAGTVMIVAVACLERVGGLADFSARTEPAGKIALGGFFLLTLLIVAAAAEELVFRGYPFQRLVDSGGKGAAVATFSALFGVAHLANPFHSWISLVNTVLVGVLLSICYLRTRALWLPIGIHFAWNFVQGYVLGFPVSGLNLAESMLKARNHGPLWLAGGAYGPEGSILTLGVILAGTAYFIFSRRIFISHEMRELALGGGNGKESASNIPRGGIVSVEKR